MPRPANNKKMANPYPIRLDEETYLKLKVMSDIEARSMNKQVELIIKKAIADYEIANGVLQVNPDDLYE